MTRDDDLSPAEIARLDALIRQAMADAPDEPGPEHLIVPWLTGTATDAERAEVLRALARSASFREDMTYVAGLYDKDVQIRFDKTPVPARGAAVGPEFDRTDSERAAAERAGSGHAEPLHPESDRPERENAPLVAPHRARPAPIRRETASRGWRWPRLLWGLPALALVALLVGRLLRTAPTPAWRADGTLRAEQFIPDPVRGPLTPSDIVTPRDAVMSALLPVVESGPEGYRLRTTRSLPVPRDRIEIPRSGIPGTLERPANADSIALWFLGIPSLRLEHASLPDAGVELAWPSPDDDQGVLVLTYRLPDGRFATLPPVACRRIR